MKSYFTRVIVAAALLAGAVSASPHHSGSEKAPQRENTQFPACDQPDGTLINRQFTGNAVAFTKEGLVPIQKSDNPVFYVAPGLGSCNFNYTDADAGVCIDGGWIRSAYHNSCNKWVEVTLPSLGTRIQARVLDSCGNILPRKNDTFGCNDIYLTLSVFKGLSLGDQKVLTSGRLPGPVSWRFIQEPCWACEAGLPGRLPFNKPDTCQGPDYYGIQRHGRKTGDERKTGAAAGEACSGFASQHDDFKLEDFAEFAKQHGYRLNHQQSGTAARLNGLVNVQHATVAQNGHTKSFAAGLAEGQYGDEAQFAGRKKRRSTGRLGSVLAYELQKEDELNSNRKQEAVENEGYE